MGTFQGHLLPGLFFTAFSLWWTVQITKRKWICDMKGIQFYSTATYNGMWSKCLTLPVEGIFKITATSIGMVLEVLASTNWGSAGRVVYMGDIQHVTMYLFFFLSGIVDILRRTSTLYTPPGLDYITTALAFSVELILFTFHLEGRSPLDVLLHTLLLYAIVGCVVSLIVEYYQQTNLLAAYTRCFFVLLQGTWFIQVGFILNPPLPSLHHWNQGDHDQQMLATMMFTWHMAADAVIMFVIAAVARFIYVKHCFIRPGCQEYDMVGKERYLIIERCENGSSELNQNGVHYDTLAANSDDEEDTVYDQSLGK